MRVLALSCVHEFVCTDHPVKRVSATSRIYTNFHWSLIGGDMRVDDEANLTVDLAARIVLISVCNIRPTFTYGSRPHTGRAHKQVSMRI